MSPGYTPARRSAALRPLGVLPMGLVAGCDVLKLGVVNHAGPVAASQWHLYLIVGAVLVFVAGPVLLLVPIMAWHYRLSNKESAFKPKWNFSWPIEGLIWIPPTGIVIGLAFVLWHYTHKLDPYRNLQSATPPLEVEAVALDWKWLFIYPREGVATVNLLTVPVGRPVHVRLTSGTVMQAMLVPRLAGQVYAMAGMTSQLNFAADRPGAYHGENTQFNGKGFQYDKFEVVALPQAGYDRWLQGTRNAANPLDATAYARLAQQSVEPRPILFSSAPAGLFQHILDRWREPVR